MTGTTKVWALLAALTLLPGAAAAFGDENWPCVQRKVEHLSWGQMWTGPALPETPRWRQDETLAELVPLLTARGVPLEEVAPLVADIGPTETESRDERLTRLFAGVFQEIDTERYKIIGGISRFAEKHRGLSQQIDAKRERARELEAVAEETDDNDAWDAFEALEDEIYWDTRIYQDRQRSITYVCESPVLLEKRAFAVAQIILGELGK
ncbi:hypothetical protein [Marinibacterium profundimaris]|uniref:Uncharacterized protein n=1 Tax=Marinibacterium profundimaris TaxID=1679460 RepID=A0A225NKS6_9RHOB|nr:hypothetical protein [Marinibacterium profundimaris]OWU74739.1 hypothetical protein ATO3_08970 [Marinibacterium profundimaris]